MHYARPDRSGGNGLPIGSRSERGTNEYRHKKHCVYFHLRPFPVRLYFTWLCILCVVIVLLSARTKQKKPGYVLRISSRIFK